MPLDRAKIIAQGRYHVVKVVDDNTFQKKISTELKHNCYVYVTVDSNNIIQNAHVASTVPYT